MADEKPEAVETPPAGEGGDNAATDAAGGDGGDGKATDKVSIPRHEYEAIAGSREELKTLREEVAQLRANGAKPPTTSPEVLDQRKEVEEREADIAELEAAARAGSREARVVLSARKDALDAEKRMLFRMEMQEVPEARRDAVRKFMSERGLASPLVANELMLGKDAPGLQSKIAELEAQIADLKKAPGRQPPKDTRVTGGGPTGAAKAGEPEAISTATYNERMARDPNGTIKARRAGKFVLVD